MPNSLRDRFMPVEVLPPNVQRFLESGVRPASQLCMFLPLLFECPAGVFIGTYNPAHDTVLLADGIAWTSEAGGPLPREIPYRNVIAAVSSLRIKLHGSKYGRTYGVWLTGPGSSSVKKRAMGIEVGLADLRRPKPALAANVAAQ